MKSEKGKTGKSRGISTYNKLCKDELMELVKSEKEASLSSAFYDDLYFEIEKTKKLYFAGPWFNEKSLAFYDAVLQITYNCNEYTKYDVFFPKNQVNNKPFDAFVKNVSNIQDCDVIVAFVDEKDMGTAWEIGMAYALGKKIILLGLDKTTFLSHTNLMLGFSGTCITLRELSKFLVDKDYETVKIKNNWEGIE